MSLKVCRFEIHDSQLTIFANSEFNRSKIDTPEIRQFLIETLETLFGRNFDLAISLDNNSSFAPPLGTNDLITTAGSIF
jgi:hypothetical protein